MKLDFTKDELVLLQRGLSLLVNSASRSLKKSGGAVRSAYEAEVAVAAALSVKLSQVELPLKV